jgi:integrase
MPLRLLQRGPGRTWYIRGDCTVWYDGRPHRRRIYQSTRSADRAKAEGVLRQIEAWHLEASITGRRPALTFAEAVIDYLRRGGSHRFLDAPLDAFGETRIDAIDQIALDSAGHRAYPAAARATLLRQWYTPVIAVLRHAGVERRFRRPRVAGGRRTHFLMPAEAELVIAAAAAGRRPSPWAAPLLTVLFGQGSRLGETLALETRDLHLEHRLAYLRATKNGRERAISLTGRAVAALSTLPNLGATGPVFRRPDGRAYAERGDRGGQIAVLFRRCVADAGLDPAIFTPHAARHSWATWFYSQTRDVVRLRDEGGWLSGEWQRYVQLSRPSIGAEAARLGWHFEGDDAGAWAGAIAPSPGVEL